MLPLDAASFKHFLCALVLQAVSLSEEKLNGPGPVIVNILPLEPLGCSMVHTFALSESRAAK